MKTVWKFNLPLGDIVVDRLPMGAEILKVAVQNEVPCIWALVDPDAEKVSRRFRIAGTGHPIEDADDLEYVSSFFLQGGDLVFHVFIYPEESNQ